MTVRRQIGYLRQQGDRQYGGVVEGIDGSTGSDFAGPTVGAAQTAAVAAAKSLGWSPPYRWDGPDADGTYLLIATDTTLPRDLEQE